MSLYKKILILSKFKKFIKKLNFYNGEKKNIILIEFNSIWSSIIPYSYLLSELSKKHDAKIIAYSNLKTFSFVEYIKNLIAKLSFFNSYAFYNSFHVNKYIKFFEYSNKINKEIAIEFERISKKIKNKKDIERLKIKGIVIGDLIYDSYLKKNLKPTINLNETNFKNFLYESIKQFYFWNNYIDKNVKAIVVSHTIYSSAIPMRICVKKNIETFQISNRHLYRLSKKNLMAYTQFKDYKKIFKKVKLADKKKGISIAKKRLMERLNGKVGVDMEYSTKSAYVRKVSKKTQLIKSKKIKILIAAHCFFDSPHSYGYNLFPDFYEWLDFLGKLSLKTDYDWYIKTHPDFLPGNKEIINKLIKRYPKIKFLPSSISHNQLVKEGIDVALTVHGTIGHEYPLFNKLVINASKNNPHINYDFNLHPKTIKEYEKTLLNLSKIIKKFKINKNEIYEFYFMRNIYDVDNFFVSNDKKLIKKNNSSLQVLDWLNNKNSDKLNTKIILKIRDFIFKNINYISL